MFFFFFEDEHENAEMSTYGQETLKLEVVFMSDYLLGDVVKNYRQENHLSLRAFGEKCGISHTTIDCIEKGYDPRTGKRVNITNITFSKLADVLKIPMSVLVDLSVGIDDLHRVAGGWMSTSSMASVLAKDSKNDIFQSDDNKKKPVPTNGEGLDLELAALIKRIPADRMPEVERYLRFQAEQAEKP